MHKYTPQTFAKFEKYTHIHKYAIIFTNMHKYTKISKICKNKQQDTQIYKNK